MIILDEKNKAIPLYMQICNQIKDDINNRNLKPDSKLPSKRKLARELGVSVNTVECSYDQLYSEGFIYSIPQKGFYVNKIDDLINFNKIDFNFSKAFDEDETNFIDFSTSKIDAEDFPYNTWRRLLKNNFDEYNNSLLNCSKPEGNKALRQSIANYIYTARGVKCDYEQIIIGAGTDNLLQMLSFILTNNFSLAIENPVYNKSAEYFKRMGHKVFNINISEKGVDIQNLKDFNNVALYVMPSHQFPLGFSMPISKRIEMLNWANSGMNRYIIEDDYDSEFRYNSKPIPALASIDTSGKVIYLGTFSKIISPALRISYMVLPYELLKSYKTNYRCFSSQVSNFEQIILEDFIEKGYFERHLNKMRKIYKQKRQLLIERLLVVKNQIEVCGEDCGHHIVVKVFNGLSEKELCQRALKNGVKVHPISKYFESDIPEEYKSTVLLGYGGLKDDEIRKGVQLLLKSWF